MARNIMLMFISKIGIDQKTGNVRRTPYTNINGKEATHTTNESALRYVLKSCALDKIFAFASRAVLKFPVGADDAKDITHYQYFKKRLQDLNLDVAKLLTEDTATDKGSVYPYEEMQSPDSDRAVWKSMGQIVEMAARIQAYVQVVRKDSPEEKIILHVDCTGGPRDAAMMIIGILRLMEYQGITIGKILYSNFESHTVDEVDEIYKLFDLIAGAEEFVRFGSVDAIQSYFENRDIPPVLKKLLAAMNKFAEAVKISRRMEFQKALEGLKTAYENFSADSKNFSTVDNIPSLNYNLMQQLKIRIAQEYSVLLQQPADDYVSIIDWCLDHGYIQQALVLYTESFPYLIIAKDELLTLSPQLSTDLAKKVDEDSMNRETEFFLLNEFHYNCTSVFNAYKNFIGKLKTSIQLIRKDKFVMDTFKRENDFETKWKGRGIIKSDYDDYLNLLDNLQTLKANHDLVSDLKTVKENLPTLYSFWNLIPENIFKIPANGRENIILKKLGNSPGIDFKRKFDHTIKIHHMISDKLLTLNNIDEEKFLLIIERYFTVKSERNDSVHARQIPKELLGGADSEISYAELLKEYMKQGLLEYSAVVSP